MTNLTNEQRANLETLAAYLEKLPADYRHFGMGFFIADALPDAERNYALKNGGVQTCGTAACAVGHGPAAGILVPPSMVKNATSLWAMWSKYARLFTGDDEEADRRFEWMFGGDWDAVDDTHYGAAARIRLFLENDVPEHFDEDYAEDWGGWVSTYAPYRIDAKAAANA